MPSVRTPDLRLREDPDRATAGASIKQYLCAARWPAREGGTKRGRPGSGAASVIQGSGLVANASCPGALQHPDSYANTKSP
jgi:hypothetical protein